MQVKFFYIFLLLFAAVTRLDAQVPLQKIEAAQFFKNESILPVTIKLDLRRLLSYKMKEVDKFPASFILKSEDSTEIREPITLEVRGNFRKANCYLPPLKVNFKSQASPVLSPLGSLKLVNVCMVGSKNNTEYLLKEYLIYKMYNLITDKSLRARLLKITYIDSPHKKQFNEYGFLLEDVKDMAKRNQCVERKRDVGHTELTDRKQMTRVALFEFMIANCDWAVTVRHNIKLIVSKKDTNTIPFAVPYDFDHSGLVNAEYALPPPHLDIKNVTDRSYRGFERSMEELQEVADEFLKQKEKMYKLVKEFDLLSSYARKEMIVFLDDFFEIISKPKEIKNEFILNARKDY